ncbi:HD-GYP domain-containing protein [Xylophilus sp. GOD-11R]|uniref:HD-GYP domain-containing protein n=1 Tax=Xylophilus sp. GOD-11R TaxID=3089814 RepID=UPI00298D3FF3|nr:HD-GYP domain-containing protein [Xylophilus sp. GOD-11R]WPB59280.1 HD-GYP domain-containing protein [Xylophilus sp. GOD-11R]
MFLHRLDGSWLNSPFWRRAFVIEDDADLHSLKTSGIQEVWIDIARGLDVAPPAEPIEMPPGDLEALAAPTTPPTAVAIVVPDDKPVPLHEELERAREICEQGKERVASMFSEIRMGRAIDAGGAVSLVNEIASSVARNPGALIGMARLKTVDDYTYMHSVAVCGLMVALATQIGLPPDEVREAGLGGLMHDVGKALMPLHVLNKPGSLSEAEFTVMKSHAEEGWRLLKNGGAVTPAVQSVALHHHERFDGSGYPARLAGEAISLHARMGAICDVYDAITSTRPYKSAWDPAHAVRQMARWKGHFDPTLFQAFIRSLGIYPIGSLVQLESGFLAVVCEQNTDTLLTPVVKAFYSMKSGARIEPRRLDLGQAGGADRIASVEDPARWSFGNLDALWIEG